MPIRSTVSALALLVSLFGTLPVALQAEELPSLDIARDRAVEEASGQLGQPTESLVVASETTRQDLEGEVIALFKIFDADHEQVIEVAVSLDGMVRDLEDLREGDRIAALEANKIGPDLAASLGQDPGSLHKILIWLSEPETFEPLPAPEGLPSNDDDLDAFDQANREAHQAHLMPLIDAFQVRLSDLGLESDYSTNAPMMWTEASIEAIEEMAGWPETSRIDLDRIMVPLMDVAHKAIFAHRVHATGNQGAFGRVGIVESGAPIVSLPGLLAPGGWNFWTHHQRSNCVLFSEHASIVMGALRSQDAVHRGVAPQSNARAGSACTWRLSDLTATTDLIIDKGSWVINFSWGFFSQGSMSAGDRYVDHVTRTRYRTFVAATGNAGEHQGSGFHLVQSPATAYSALAVGSFDDKGTVTRLDDRIAPQSSFGSPPSQHGDRIKPNLVAPGVRVLLPSHGFPTWKEVTDTSVAAPMVAGTAALVLEAQPWLYFHPEALRAVVMASATHDFTLTTSSDRKGAGGIDAQEAVSVANVRAGDWGSISMDCGGPRRRDLATVALHQGMRFRAAITWSADPTFPGNPAYDIEPGSDLDLLLFDSNGRVVARSNSFDNTHEVIEFADSPNNQTATLSIVRVGCSIRPGTVGWAWWNDGLN